MADKPTQLILEALSRAAACPTGMPLHGNKTAPGLFPPTAPARLAAERCKDEGYLHSLRTESKGKLTQEVYALSEKGLAFLFSQVSPRQVLEDLVRVLEARHDQVADLLNTARSMQASLDALKSTAERVLNQVQQPAQPGPVASTNGSESWPAALLAHLSNWQAAGASEDCPLPELYRRVQQTAAGLTIGQFHDGLRRLHDQGQVYLHPWTGPLYDMPEPPYALLIGHEIAYYASMRKQ